MSRLEDPMRAEAETDLYGSCEHEVMLRARKSAYIIRGTDEIDWRYLFC